MRQATVSFLNRWPHRKLKSVCFLRFLTHWLTSASLDLDCQFCFDSYQSHSRLQTLESPRNLGISIHEDSIIHILLVPKKRHVELSKISSELLPTQFFLQSSFQALLSKIFLVGLIPDLDSHKTYSRKSLPTALPIV